MFQKQALRITEDGNGKFYVEQRTPYGIYEQQSHKVFDSLEEAERYARSLKRKVVKEIE